MKRVTLDELKRELKLYIETLFDDCIAKYGEKNDASLMLHWFETTYMKPHLANMALDHRTFRIFLREVITQFYTKKEVDKKLSDAKWYLIDFINESILTVLPYKDKDGNKIDPTLDIKDVLGRVLYDFQSGRLFQYRENEDGAIISSVLSGHELRDNQIVFMENMPTIEESIYYMKDGKLVSFLATQEHAGLLSKEDKVKIDSFGERIDDIESELPNFVREVALGEEANVLQKTDEKVVIPIATENDLGAVKAGENVTIGADGSINVDVPVSIDEVVNLRSVTTEPETANEGDCYYNSTDTLVHYYVNGAWDAGTEPQKSKVYFFTDGNDIHQYRSDGDILIEIQDTPQIATQESVGIVKGGENVTIGADGSVNVSFDGLQNQIDDITDTINNLPDLPEQKEYKVATETELGLVKASSKTNNTAEALESDGNVQVSADGKMRVRKLIDKVEVGNNKYTYSINPDENIENLRESSWTHTEESIVPIKPFEDGYSISQLYEAGDENIAIFKNLTVGQNFNANIYNNTIDTKYSYEYTKLISGNLKPENGDKYELYKVSVTIKTYIQVVDANGNVLYDEQTDKSNTLHINSITEDMLPLYIKVVFNVTTKNELVGTTNTIKTPDLKTSWCNLDVTIDGATYDGVEITEKETVVTEIKGSNIVLGKNGLLIQSQTEDAYVKVLEDGSIEHNFGATQNTGQANVIEQVTLNGETLPIENKTVDIDLETAFITDKETNDILKQLE